MARRLRHELTYDAPAAAVMSMLADRSFREEVSARQRVVRSTVTVDGDPSEGIEVTIDEIQPAAGIPSFAQKFVGNEINVVRHESWSADHEADVRVTIPGKPGEISGTARLEESGGVTTEAVDLTVKVSIPLVGGKLEGLVSDLLLRSLEIENKVGRDYLAR